MRLKNIRDVVLIKGIFFVLIASGTLGCARVGVNMVGAPMVSNMVDRITDTRSARLVKDGLAGQVLSTTAITEMSPNNFRLLKECALLYCVYGLFIEDEDPEYAKELYSIGKEYGLRALKQDSKFKEGLEGGKRISELVDDLGKKYAEALCWTGLNGGLWLILNLDDPAVLMKMADIIAVVKRSIALDPSYFYGVGEIFIGAYYALVPSFLDPAGGPENSKKMFQEARSISDGKFLLVDLFEARFLATSMNDRDLFKKRLEDVLSADSGELKGAYLINDLSKIKAKYYLSHQDELF
jgi:hypothetical protein